MSKERIQKVLARQGLGSRRQIESWIKEGQVSLNGSIIGLGQQVEAGDVVMHGGRKIIIRDAEQALPRVLAYHKPEGEVCTRSDPEGRPTIFDTLPGLKHSRWVAVGRLDINTSGLILLTDSGDLANKLMHPSTQIQREYAVRVMGAATKQQLEKLTNGIELEDGPARFDEIVERSFVDEERTNRSSINHWYHVVLMEGRNREVRRLWEAVDLKVSRLMRVRYGSVIMTKSQRPGQTRELDPEDIRELAELAGIEYAKNLRSGKPIKKDYRMTKHKAPASRGRPGSGRSSSTGGRQGSRTSASSGGRTSSRTSAPSGGRKVNNGKHR